MRAAELLAAPGRTVGLSVVRDRIAHLDARWLQIGFLGSLLLAGALLRDFALAWPQVLLTFAAALATQAAWSAREGLPASALLSAAVTSLGLSILLRADSFWVHPLIATLAISAKFIIRVRGKHLFNPANLGVIAAVTLLPGAWISPGQWGSDWIAALWFVVLGVMVTTRARRFDIAWAFLACYVALLVGRVVWFDMRWAVLGNQLANGALLLFTFFMITDPRTTPDDRTMRFLYAALVAGLAFIWQFAWFKPAGPIWALFLLTPLVPLLDWLRPAARFQWRKASDQQMFNLSSHRAD